MSSGDSLRAVYEDGDVQITHLAGTSGSAVVSFTGIGFALGGIQIQEFRKSLAGTDHDLWFVIDKQRHWYNEAYDRIIDVLNQDLQARHIRNTMTLGNSMGGFGAILFAGRLHRCSHAVAFSAQSAVDPAIAPWENRWKQHTGSIEHWRGLDAARAMVHGVEYRLFFGGNDGNDRRHAERFANAPPASVTICMVEDADHELVGFLKGKGVLAPLIRELTQEDGVGRDFRTIMSSVRHTVLQK